MGRNVRRCAGCPGNGIRCPATPSCRLSLLQGWTVVEHCDTCDRYPDDLAATAALFLTVKWVTCANGGLHAVGKDPVETVHAARLVRTVRKEQRTRSDQARTGSRPKENPDHV
jgi:hypothetical protein